MVSGYNCANFHTETTREDPRQNWRNCSLTPFYLILFCLPLAQQSPDGVLSVVVRSAGRPIAQASVRIQENELLTALTGPEGTARIAFD